MGLFQPRSDDRVDESADTESPRGRTVADEEIERAIRKGQQGNVLDPVALDDPMGKGVERVIMRVGVTVFIILIVGILLAQVACKSIRLATVPDFATDGAGEDSMVRALSHGVGWAGDIVRYPGVSFSAYDEKGGALEVVETIEGNVSAEQLISDALERSAPLAINVFEDPSVNELRYLVRAHVVGSEVTTEDGTIPEALSIVWTRVGDENPTYSFTLEGDALAVRAATRSEAAPIPARTNQ